ncbi:hypothetical protein BDR22DRAFT_271142 [Usnea florida]
MRAETFLSSDPCITNLHLLIMYAQMLTQARALEMNITCCKMLQAKLLEPEALEALEARIALCIEWLEAIEKHGSCTVIPDPGTCVLCEVPFSTTRDRSEEIVHCCFSRAHTRCLDTSAPTYSHKDMASTCGTCSGALTKKVYERIAGYAALLVNPLMAKSKYLPIK